MGKLCSKRHFALLTPFALIVVLPQLDMAVKQGPLLQVAAAVGVSCEHRGGGHAPPSVGLRRPLQRAERAAVRREHLPAAKGTNPVRLNIITQGTADPVRVPEALEKQKKGQEKM